MPYSFARLRVIVVDDSRFQRSLLRVILRSFDIADVHEVATGEDAMSRMAHANFDLMILDYKLEDGLLNGLEVTKTLRSLRPDPRAYTPIIMVTAHADTDLVVQARDAGVTELLVKPVSARSLLARIVAVVERPRPFVETRGYFGPCRRRQLLETYNGPLRRSGDQPARIDADQFSDALDPAAQPVATGKRESASLAAMTARLAALAE